MYKYDFNSEELAKIEAFQKDMLQKFRTTKRGTIVEKLGNEFIVFPNVFWPSEDGTLLIKNLKINAGSSVLDVGTGTGVLAIFAALAGAKKVVALDINQSAIDNAKENIRQYGLSNIVDVRLSDMFNNLSTHEKFDIITANLPFNKRNAIDVVEQSLWDTDFQTNRNFFSAVKKHLKPDGKIYFVQSNFSEVDEIVSIAQEKEFNIELVGQTESTPEDPRIFYTFLFTLSK